MSWLDRIKNIKLEIITGDGKSYFPLWKDATKEIGFNSQTYNFVGIAGSYVDRKLKVGTKYPLLLWFQGENNIDESNDFLKSSEDIRPWTIKHPLYDDIQVQPIALNIDNSVMNVTKISGTVIETISNKYPDRKENIRKKIETEKADLDKLTEDNFPEKMSTETIEAAEKAVVDVEQNFDGLAKTLEEIKKFKDFVRAVKGAAKEIANKAKRFIQNMQDLINFPFSVISDIKSIATSVTNAIDDLKETLLGLGIESSEDNKKIYESTTTTLLSEICLNAVNPLENDFITRTDVIEIIDKIVLSYESVLKNFDDVDYLQNAQMALKLDNIIKLTIGNLYDIAFKAKQERGIILENDNNIINLTHRFYGISDENIEKFVAQNNISLEEHLLIKKGRKLIWYV